MIHLRPTEQVVVSFKSIGGKAQAVTLKPKPGQARGQMLLEGDERPDGAWQATNNRLGLSVRQVFDVREVEQCLLDWFPAKQRFNFELLSPEKTLAPGEAITMAHRYQVKSGK
jgi:hypothetical protein